MNKKISIIVSVLTVISVIEAIVIIGTENLSFDLDYQFLTNVTLVMLPIVSGIITTKWISNSWQKRKETNDIKKEIINNYTKSFGREYTMLGEFVGLLYNNYIDLSAVKETPEKGIQHSMKFPTEDKEKPFILHMNMWKEFEKEFWKNTYNKNEFLSSFRLYYNDEELSKDIMNANSMLNQIFNRTGVFLYSKTLKEFDGTYKKLTKELDDVLTSSMKIESKLIKNNIEIK